MQRFLKSERVSSQKVISALYSKGNFSLYEPPFQFGWIYVEPIAGANCQVLIVSSKRKLKSSVDRNRQKRQLRELYRLSKDPLLSFLAENQISIALSINYVGVEPLLWAQHDAIFKNAISKITRAVKKNYSGSFPVAH